MANEGSYRGNFLDHKDVEAIELGEVFEDAGGEMNEIDDGDDLDEEEEEDVVESGAMEIQDQGYDDCEDESLLDDASSGDNEHGAAALCSRVASSRLTCTLLTYILTYLLTSSYLGSTYLLT